MSTMVRWLTLLSILFVAVTSSSVADDVSQKQNDSFHQQQEQEEISSLSWKELDQRPNPLWYDNAKVGIFLHWGVFSVPAYGSEWFWSYWRDNWSKDYSADITDFVKKTEKSNFVYQDYAQRFDAALYRPNEDWAPLFARSGAQYIVLTSKHHDGFPIFDSRSIPATWNWNAMDIGPHRDLLGELAMAVKNTTSKQTNQTLKFGIYHSMYEWYNPLYHDDKKSNFTSQNFVKTKTMPELYNLVKQYEPEILWSDGEWEAHSDYWTSREFLSWAVTKSTVKDTVIWNDRWGTDTLCKHGSFLTCTDRYEPNATQSKKWENAMTIDKNSWSWNRNSTKIEDYYTTTELIHTLISTISKNGNLLINIGPSADGTISPIFMDRLLGLGEWLSVNGQAVYNTKPWLVCSNETDSYYYTRTQNNDDNNNNVLYVHMTKWPSGNLLQLNCPKPTYDTTAFFVGVDNDDYQNVMSHSVTIKKNPSGQNSGMILELPSLTPDTIPYQHAWVIGLKGISNLDHYDNEHDEGDNDDDGVSANTRVE